jgi:AcrR family transcriptional regulator
VPDTAVRRPLRADARRNHQRILDAAQQAFAVHGAGASLEEIARRAGVGSATLHRHFPSRRSLLEAVFRDRVEALCAKARQYARDSEPGTALFAWLRDFNAYAATCRGLAAALAHEEREPARVRQDEGCTVMITSAAGELLRRAQRSGAARADLRVDDLLALVGAISLATEHRGDEEQARRLLDIAIDGVRVP